MAERLLNALIALLFAFSVAGAFLAVAPYPAALNEARDAD